MKNNNYYDNNKEKIKLRAKLWYQANKEIVLKQRKIKYLLNRDKRLQYAKSYVIKNKEKYLKYQSDYRQKNNIKLKKYFKIRNKRDRIKLNKQHIINKKIRYHKDINFRLRECLGARIRQSLKYGFKSKSTLKLIGCSIKQLRNYLQSKFKNNMSWSNYGKWHIDHIRPCCSFDLSKPSQQRKCFHYTNLQPLWALENLRKGKK